MFPLSRPHRPLGSGPWVPYEAICKRGVVLAAPTAAAECQGTLGMSLVPWLPLVVRCGAPESHYRRGLVGIYLTRVPRPRAAPLCREAQALNLEHTVTPANVP